MGQASVGAGFELRVEIARKRGNRRGCHAHCRARLDEEPEPQPGSGDAPEEEKRPVAFCAALPHSALRAGPPAGVLRLLRSLVAARRMWARTPPVDWPTAWS